MQKAPILFGGITVDGIVYDLGALGLGELVPGLGQVHLEVIQHRKDPLQTPRIAGGLLLPRGLAAAVFLLPAFGPAFVAARGFASVVFRACALSLPAALPLAGSDET